MQPTNALISRVQSGAAWTADTSLLSVALVAPYLRFKVTNTSTNTNAYIYSFGGYNSGTGDLTLKVAKNSTTNITQNTVTPTNQNTGATNSPALQVTYDTNASDVAGGTPFRTLVLPTRAWTTFNDQIIILSPGQSLTLSGQFLIAASGVFHMSWFEQSN